MLCYWDIFKCIKFLLAHLPYQAHLHYEPVSYADSWSRRINCEMNYGNRWWALQDQLPAGAMIVPVSCASHQTHLSNFSAIQ
jgi:hypothetical protein